MLRLSLLGLCAALLLGCPRRAPELPASLLAIDVSAAFVSAQDGTLRFAVDVPPEVSAVDSLTWDCTLAGRRFASGVEGNLSVKALPGGGWRVTVNSPLSSRHLTYREGATWVVVEVAGALTARQGTDAVRLPFAGRAELLLQGVPVADER